VLQKYSISFDTSVAEILYPLVSGAALVVARPGGQYDIGYLIELVRDRSVTAIDIVPTMLKAMVEDSRIASCASLRLVTCGGEALSVELEQQVRDRMPAVELANVYGPTEATITATYYRCEPRSRRSSVPIGRPIANTQLYILDKNLQPVPVGVTGEIYIGGYALAVGYQNQPELTAAAFIPNPFSDEPGARMYKTGDLGRYLDDGNIEYAGRADEQVKLRGFRIELGEIEACLRRHTAVKDAAAMVREDEAGQKRLVAYAALQGASTTTPQRLRDYLKEALPEHMIPAAIVMVNELPLTASGKIDRNALPAPDVTRPELEADYAEPRSEVEKELVRIWQEALGVDRVGINDNFFALGGDSILSIQIIARAREAGIEVTPKQIFKHQTISGLARVAAAPQSFAARPERVKGMAPLTPIQHWFFEQELEEPHHYNQALVLEVKRDARASILEKAFERVVEHHDALRLRFDLKGQGWQQSPAPRETHQVFRRVGMSHLAEREQAAEIERIANHAQASLDLRGGPIIRAVCFDLGARSGNRLLTVIHHLAVDGVSWRVLLEDLHRACEQLEQGEEVRLPRKTLSFKRWAELLAERAQADDVLGELEYWTAPPRYQASKLPVDYVGEANTVADARSVVARLTAEETRRLLQEVPAAYRTQINDALLAALAMALAGWTGESRLLLDLEGHGREEIVDGADVSRTVGWFTTIFPVLIELNDASDVGQTLRSVKEQLRRIPNRGIGYGLLRYLSADRAARERLKDLPQPEISFNYLGQLDRAIDRSSLFALAEQSAGDSRSGLARRSHLIELDASVTGGRLEIEWAYGSRIHSRETIERLAATFIEKLRSLIAHCSSADSVWSTPSDFPLARLDQMTLDRFEPEGGRVEDIYPLSPMQQGMLFHSLYEPHSDVYCTQLFCRIEGEIDRAAFRAAWQAVIEHHPALRTSFEWEALEEPLQVVRRGTKLSIDERDWRGLEGQEQTVRLEHYLNGDRRKGFDLRRAPLMRLALMRVGAREHLFVWTSHHLLLDGWSLPLVLGDVFQVYEATRRKEPATLERGRPYRDYIAWLRRQDLSKAEEFWRRLLKGFTAPTTLGTPSNNSAGGTDGIGRQEVKLTEAMTSTLDRLARQHQVTLNTIVQGAWALLLAAYAGKDDVVFGAVTSGRSPEVAGIESMVGLFINTLPVRVRIPADARLLDWLKGLQAEQAEVQQYEYSPLSQAQAWSEVPPGTPLFESLFLFENYPMDPRPQARLEAQTLGISARDIHLEESSNYPLTTWVNPDKEMSLRIAYDRRRFDDAIIGSLLDDYRALLEAASSNPRQTVGELSRFVNARLSAAPLGGKAEAARAGSQPGARERAPLNAPPPSPLEQAIAGMWREVLSVDRVASGDNFFELGGRPAQAAELLYRVRDLLNADVPLAAFFQAPTVSGLAQAVTASEKVPGRAEKIARVLNRVEGMSAEDLREKIQNKERRRSSHEGDTRVAGCD
jgi:non-ribosomal peptide synthase protein (TIGR01720 family)